MSGNIYETDLVPDHSERDPQFPPEPVLDQQDDEGQWRRERELEIVPHNFANESTPSPKATAGEAGPIFANAEAETLNSGQADENETTH